MWGTESHYCFITMMTYNDCLFENTIFYKEKTILSLFELRRSGSLR